MEKDTVGLGGIVAILPSALIILFFPTSLSPALVSVSKLYESALASDDIAWVVRRPAGTNLILQEASSATQDPAQALATSFVEDAMLGLDAPNPEL